MEKVLENLGFTKYDEYHGSKTFRLQNHRHRLDVTLPVYSKDKATIDWSVCPSVRSSSENFKPAFSWTLLHKNAEPRIVELLEMFKEK